MSRSGYYEDIDNWAMIKCRGMVASALRGKRGQRLLHDIIAALDALPVKELITSQFELDGQVCTLGSVAKLRGLPVEDIKPDDDGYIDGEAVGNRFNVAECLAREVMHENDDGFCGTWKEIESPAARWARMRKWAVDHLRPVPPPRGAHE